MKKCSKCEQTKSINNFGKAKRNSDGLNGWCKDCFSKYNKRYNEENKEKMAKWHKEYREANREKLNEYSLNHYYQNKDMYRKNKEIYESLNQEEIKKYRKEYYKNNKEEISDWHRNNYKENKNEILERTSLYMKNNKEKYLSYIQKRRAMKKELPNNLTIAEWNGIVKDFSGKCSYCGRYEKLEQEHFIALSKGGEYTINNIIPACRSCNASKSNQDFFAWYPKHESYSRERERFILEYLGYKNRIQQLSIL